MRIRHIGGLSVICIGRFAFIPKLVAWTWFQTPDQFDALLEEWELTECEKSATQDY